ncbi:hypothetical protein TVAG_206820 [Trichomonas vaginalis G3]|uniref:Uncharacterized protein n=1 Tax=Trichomonas vaginalis (strain ATCC PRA-98 / G3) TaxID=412133 RepID=A2EY60_TRIV3|nr:negative elongation factor D family [Trichomonas vaginalis G3]EAY02406.1 hypothetical protein TVAG_206820 [Trichomonas vaginalis G3]KAI5535525.1 negative elongation factor D family [Trichomonas vaginalis G3]|eukprot:XP_001330659.1 hypothetical protein [Trichomonas vaginalis G3]
MQDQSRSTQKRSRQAEAQSLYEQISDDRELIETIGSILETNACGNHKIAEELQNKSMTDFQHIINPPYYTKLDAIFELDEPPVWIEPLIEDKKWATIIINLASKYPDSKFFKFCYNLIFKIHPELIDSIPANSLGSQDYTSFLIKTITAPDFGPQNHEKLLRIILTDDLTLVKSAMLIYQTHNIPLILDVYKWISASPGGKKKADLYLRIILSFENCSHDMFQFIIGETFAQRNCARLCEQIINLNREITPITAKLAITMFNKVALTDAATIKKLMAREDEIKQAQPPIPQQNPSQDQENPSSQPHVPPSNQPITDDQISRVVDGIKNWMVANSFRDFIALCRYRFFSVQLVELIRERDLAKNDLVRYGNFKETLEEKVFCEIGFKHEDLRGYIVSIVGDLLACKFEIDSNYDSLFKICRCFIYFGNVQETLNNMLRINPKCRDDTKRIILKWMEGFEPPFSPLFVNCLLNLLLSEPYSKAVFMKTRPELAKGVKMWVDKVTTLAEPRMLNDINRIFSDIIR